MAGLSIRQFVGRKIRTTMHSIVFVQGTDVILVRYLCQLIMRCNRTKLFAEMMMRAMKSQQDWHGNEQKHPNDIMMMMQERKSKVISTLTSQLLSLRGTPKYTEIDTTRITRRYYKYQEKSVIINIKIMTRKKHTTQAIKTRQTRRDTEYESHAQISCHWYAIQVDENQESYEYISPRSY